LPSLLDCGTDLGLLEHGEQLTGVYVCAFLGTQDVDDATDLERQAHLALRCQYAHGVDAVGEGVDADRCDMHRSGRRARWRRWRRLAAGAE